MLFTFTYMLVKNMKPEQEHEQISKKRQGDLESYRS